MAQGPEAHVGSEKVIAEAAAGNGHPAPVTSSAGALVRTLQEIGALKVAMITPYMKPLTQMVVDYIEGPASRCWTPLASRWRTTSRSVAWTRRTCPRLPAA